MQELIVPAVLGALALVALVLAVVVLLGRAQTDRRLRAAQAEAASLRAQLDELERRLPPPAGQGPGEGAPQPADGDASARPEASPGYVITHVGEQPAAPRHATPAAPGDVGPSLFADLVLRETVVRAASLVHGLRVALAPETRHHIRLEVRREIRRARRQRRADTKAALRQYQAHQRAELPDDGSVA